MAQAQINEGVLQPRVEISTSYTVTLSEDEAMVIMALCRSVGGFSKYRIISSHVGHMLQNAGAKHLASFDSEGKWRGGPFMNTGDYEGVLYFKNDDELKVFDRT